LGLPRCLGALRRRRHRWIGYNDLDASAGEEPADGWEWESGSGSTYPHWTGGQPDNYDNNEDCAHLYGDSGYWNDLPCGNDDWYGTYLHSVCESGID